MRVQASLIVVSIAVLGLAAGCLEEGNAQTNAEAESSEQDEGSSESESSNASEATGASTEGAERSAEAQRGAELFESECASCHGSDATGTRAGPSLRPIAGELAEGDAESTVRSQIAGGGGRMPPFSHLEDEEVDALVAHLTYLGEQDEENSTRTAESDDGESSGSESERRWGGQQGRGCPWRGGKKDKNGEGDNNKNKNKSKKGCRMNHGSNWRGDSDDDESAEEEDRGRSKKGCRRMR